MRAVPLTRLALLAALAITAAGCASPTPATQTGSSPPPATAAAPSCPGHWHATFALFVPGPDGSPARIDFASPVTPSGLHYYDYAAAGNGGDPKLTMALHMHQSGTETGSSELGPAQWHFEGGRCVAVSEALHDVDVDANTHALNLYGGHNQVPGQSGLFASTSSSPLRWWVLQAENGTWTWREVDWASVGGLQLQDGASLLGALGRYSEAQVAQMQSQVPAPISRP